MPNKLKLPPDFVVQYKFYSPEEGGRENGTPIQGYRCDFVYSEELTDELHQRYMIWPIFLDLNDNYIPDNTNVPLIGKAEMYIVSPLLRKHHQSTIKVGTKGYFKELKKIAELTIIEIKFLFSNPTESISKK